MIINGASNAVFSQAIDLCDNLRGDSLRWACLRLTDMGCIRLFAQYPASARIHRADLLDDGAAASLLGRLCCLRLGILRRAAFTALESSSGLQQLAWAVRWTASFFNDS